MSKQALEGFTHRLGGAAAVPLSAPYKGNHSYRAPTLEWLSLNRHAWKIQTQMCRCSPQQSGHRIHLHRAQLTLRQTRKQETAGKQQSPRGVLVLLHLLQKGRGCVCDWQLNCVHPSWRKFPRHACVCWIKGRRFASSIFMMSQILLIIRCSLSAETITRRGANVKTARLDLDWRGASSWNIAVCDFLSPFSLPMSIFA